MGNKMKPQTLKGFCDYFADDMKVRNFIKDTFRELAEKYGFEPLETPALEYSELILGQSGEEAEKLYYKFKDNGDRDVMLKYELMIPMCRAVAENINDIQMPYKRYQIQNVWRAENVQKGRLREFTQMDIDTLGSDSPFADAEILQFGLNFLDELGFKKYRVRINNREIILGIINTLSIDEENFEDIYITIDKLEKIGGENVRKELIETRGIDKEKVDALIEIIKISDIEALEKKLADSEIGMKGIKNVKEIISILNDFGIKEEFVKFDLSLARGLASYTGAVWEFEVIDGDVGSVSGGGRYDKAVSKYIGREIPATGTSFGLERLAEIIKDRNMLKEKTQEGILIIPLARNVLPYAISVANKLRKSCINSNLYPNLEKLKSSLRYADRKNYNWVIIIGEEERERDVVQLKNMKTKEQFTLTVNETVKKISI